ncbi:MAG: hypothetical protein IRY95_10805 [Clostridia bacterium]|nr:hypothetical protein [Clostridia bacterium]
MALPVRHRRYNADGLHAILVQVRRQLGRIPTKDEFYRVTGIHPSTVVRHLGSWRRAWREASGWSSAARREELHAVLARVVREIGHVPGQHLYERHRRAEDPAAAELVGAFGSWRQVLANCGLPQPRAGPPQRSDEELLRGLRAYVDELGRLPSMREAAAAARTRPGLANPTTYVRRFGSWTEALHRAALLPVEDGAGAGAGTGVGAGSATHPVPGPGAGDRGAPRYEPWLEEVTPGLRRLARWLRDEAGRPDDARRLESLARWLERLRRRAGYGDAARKP